MRVHNADSCLGDRYPAPTRDDHRVAAFLAYHAPMTAPSTVGERLKAERERRGIGRVSVTRATGILVHDLAALEFGRFEDLPENVIEPWVRAYARHLGLDGDALVADLRRERGMPEGAAPPRAAATTAAPAPDRSPRRLALTIGVPVLLAVVVGAWWVVRTSGPENKPPPESPVQAAPVEPSPVPSPTPSPAPSPTPSPSPRPSSPPSPHPAARPASLTIAAHGVGTGIEDHRLTGASDSFREGTEVWFWTDVRGGASGGTVRHVWRRDGRAVQTVSLRLGGARWRTQSSFVLPAGSEGAWSVEARDRDGHVLARDEFRCVR